MEITIRLTRSSVLFSTEVASFFAGILFLVFFSFDFCDFKLDCFVDLDVFDFFFFEVESFLLTICAPNKNMLPTFINTICSAPSLESQVSRPNERPIEIDISMDVAIDVSITTP